MAEITEYDKARNQSYTRTVKSGADVANAQATTRMTDASRLGSMGKKTRKAPPKQSDFGGDLRAYSEAMRKHRLEEESDSDSAARSRALSRLKN